MRKRNGERSDTNEWNGYAPLVKTAMNAPVGVFRKCAANGVNVKSGANANAIGTSVKTRGGVTRPVIRAASHL